MGNGQITYPGCEHLRMSILIERQRVWELDPRGFAEARLYLDRISAQWDDALARLQAFVEG